jgi:hypothetical protein
MVRDGYAFIDTSFSTSYAWEAINSEANANGIYAFDCEKPRFFRKHAR